MSNASNILSPIITASLISHCALVVAFYRALCFRIPPLRIVLGGSLVESASLSTR